MAINFPYINEGFQLHYYLNESSLFDIYKYEFPTIDLNEVGTDVLSLCNGNNSVDDIVNILYSNVKYDKNIDKNRGIDLIRRFLSKFNEQDVIINSNSPHQCLTKVSGVRGAKYPFFAYIELTDKCNFLCGHCYKNAKPQNTTYIKSSIYFDIIDELRHKTKMIGLSGGEPTLHPQINELIKYMNHDFSINLYTNGSHLELLSNDSINSIRQVVVSLYGYSEESYFENTMNKNSFISVCEGIRRLTKKNVDIITSITINRKNLFFLEEYIKLINLLEIKKVSFGLVLPSGRYAINRDDIWNLTDDEVAQIPVITRSIAKMFPHINIQIFDDNKVSLGRNDSASVDRNNNFKCLAGRKALIFSEEGNVMPCAYLPKEVYSGVYYKDYFSEVRNENKFKFTKNVDEFEKYLHEKGFKLEDMRCMGFYS